MLNHNLNRMVEALAGKITAERESNRVLEMTVKEKEELAEVRASLIHVFGHNAATPITYLIRSTEELLLEEPTHEEFRAINQAARELKRLSENVMTYLKLHEGNLTPAQEEVSLAEVTTLLVELHQDRCNRKRLAVAVDVPQSCTLTSDYFLTRIVLENLVHNAVKYSFPDGVIRIDAVCAETGLSWTICDGGPGIADADKLALYGRFRVLSSRPTGGESSTGLGLYLVRELVGRLGGTIQLIDTENPGPCFRVWLPVASGNELV